MAISAGGVTMVDSNDRNLSMWVPILPPSENRIRVHRRQGGQVYSKEAKDFKKLFAEYVRREYLVDVSVFVRGHHEKAIYELELSFVFETVINKGWAKKQAKTLYKRFDVGNRRKLLEDCLVEVLGEIDDCLFFKLTLTKSMGLNPGVSINLKPVNPADYGVPDVRRH
jgi:Holliday junction resolvase RusA-like endonuclease